MKLSAIISTRDRMESLRNAIISLRRQTLSPELYEILVIDNGHSNDTGQAVEKLNSEGGKEILYFVEEKPGLHNARHRGVKESKSEILAFTDDDAVADSRWLEEILESFEKYSAALAGGKILPRYEIRPPEWVNSLWRENEHGKYLGYLTLMDMGDETKEIPPDYIWGANFSIRKKTLFECGGFHPDAFPNKLIRYRGDGESALALAVAKTGGKIIYNPESIVYHIIPEDHLRLKYFRHRAFLQGISDSFTEIRNKGAVPENTAAQKPALKISEIRKYLIEKSFSAGKKYHRQEVLNDKDLLDYVLKQDYMK